MKEVYGPDQLVSILYGLTPSNYDLIGVTVYDDIYHSTIESVTFINEFTTSVDDWIYQSLERNDDVKLALVRGCEVERYNELIEEESKNGTFLDFLKVDWKKKKWNSDMCDNKDCCPVEGHDIKPLEYYG